MGIKLEGFNEFQKTLDGIAKKAEQLDGQHDVPFSELFNDDFINKHTSLSSIQELLDKSGFKIESKEDFNSIPDDQWDTYIKSVTDFDSWEDMMEEAISELVARQLGL